MPAAPRPDARRTVLSAAFVLAASLVTAAPAHAAARAQDPAAARAQDPAAARDRDQSAVLTCTLSTAPGRPITFSPPVRLQPRTVTTSGTLNLRDCASSGRVRSRIATGTMTFRGRARTGCTTAAGPRGGADITWYDARGHRLATSHLSATGQGRASLAEIMLNGRVTSGHLAGHRASGSLTPAGRLTNCALTGTATIQGTGRLTIT
ncbi:hypothetical protein [Actinomadura gamaensis]|uniref:Uncharacterized protein n=1 Tax=Actinomadura gamaensis TaxID=1763541 RepID=A0ABV9U667_9ACTN